MKDPDPIPPFEIDLAWRIDLINSMIAQNQESTIRDYLGRVEEMELIEITRKFRDERKVI